MVSMVRPEEHTRGTEQAEPGVGSGRIVSAGESPAPVSAEAPGSGPHGERESAPPRAGHRKPVQEGRERSGGPQRVVNVEQASSDYQPKGDWERRADHVAGKATHSAGDSESALGLPGGLAAERPEGTMRNRKEPSRRSTSGATNGISAGRESEPR